MMRFATLATAMAVALASPSFTSALAASDLVADESETAVMAAAEAVDEARSHADEALAGKDLKPGHYWWDAKAAAGDGPVEVVVSLADQRAYVYQADELIGVTTISSGKPGKDTPPGIFPILEKQRMYHSRKYDNAPMPFMQRIDQYGIALHAGPVLDHPASHGCVRLPAGFAQKLYAITNIGDRVVIG